MTNAAPLSSWREVEHCPGCGADDVTPCGSLAGDAYLLADRTVPFPENGIRIVRCPECRLIYKSVVPPPAVVARAFAGEDAWLTPYGFQAEAHQIRSLLGRDGISLLDVGAADGALLRACRDFASRRSALDLAAHARLDGTAITGEFIRGALDDPSLSWSGDPYDVVTLFDVFEHLYDVPACLKNLEGLLAPGGLLVIETGDAESRWPKRHGVARWWYARLFEHHLFWSRPAFERLVIRHPFELVMIRSVRHKARAEVPAKKTVVEALKTLAYSSWPRGYESLARRTGRAYWQPTSPFARDHLRLVLRRRY